MFFKLFSKPQPEPDDGELVRQYRETGEVDLVGRLFARHSEMVYLVCCKYLKDEEAAKDAAMQLFEHLLESLKKHEVSNFKSWLHVTTKNHCLMQLRSSRKQPVQRPDDINILADMHFSAYGHPDADEELEFSLTLLEQGLVSLPEEQRACVKLFYLQQHSYKEIAAQTGLDLNKVRSHIQNGRRNLKIYLEKNHETH
ncbi:MAG: RNA polymerase sigma factor [Adhaeribacter sp.]